MDPRQQFIRRVERTHAVIACLACIVAIAMSNQAVWSGVLLGALLGGLNFRALAMLAAKFTTTGDNAVRSATMGLIIGKMVAIFAAVGVVMVFANPDGVAFIGGISLAPIALVLVSMWFRPSFDVSAESAVSGGSVAVSPSPEVQR